MSAPMNIQHLEEFFIAIAGNHPTLNEQKYFKKLSLFSNGVT